MKAKAAAIYARISSDPRGLEAGVKRQERDCRALARERGWKVASVYTDNDKSGWNGAERPEYQRMLSDIEAGSVDAVVFWKLDRLTRRITDFSQFYKLCNERGVEFISAKEAIDTTSPLNVGVVHLLASVGEQESHNTSVRLQRRLEEDAKNGKAHSGGLRAFGYERDGLKIRNDEARLIRRAAKRVLAGEGLIGIVADWNDQGIATAGGGTWSTRSVKRILTEPRWAGVRTYKGAVVAKAEWPAIIAHKTHERLKALLLNPSRSNGGTTARKYLLPGFVFCGLCETRMVSRPRKGGEPSYACVSVPPYSGCGGVSVIGPPLEELIAETVLYRLDSPRLAKALRAAAGQDEEQANLLEAIGEDEASLDQLTQDHYVNRLIPKAEFLKARRALEDRLEATKRQLAQRERANVLANVPSGGAALRREWERRDLQWRRALIGAVLEKIIVNPAPARGRNSFDPNRVEVVWRV